MSDNPDIKGGDNAANVAADTLRHTVERIERLEEEKAALSDDIKEFYAEAKSKGFDSKTLRKLIALRKKDPADAREEHELLALYARSLGMGVFG